MKKTTMTLNEFLNEYNEKRSGTKKESEDIVLVKANDTTTSFILCCCLIIAYIVTGSYAFLGEAIQVMTMK